MNLTRYLHPPLAALCTLWLAACGGGGDARPPPAAVGPSSGVFAWLLKAEGPTERLKFGLSLIHPQETTTEYVIEPASAAVTDAKLVASATVDTAAQQTSTLEPYALVYIVGGDVRRVPLKANGAAPASRVSRAKSTSACRFVLEAVDYAAPENSRFIVSTAGADGQCGTDSAPSADDARAEVRLDAASGGLVFAPLSGEAPLAALRDPATLAPRGWLFPAHVQLWSAAPGTSITVRPASDPITRVVQSTYRSALVESARGLSVLDFGNLPSVNETPLTTITSSGWQAIGFDAQNYYAYRNAGSTSSGDATWAVLRVSRSAAAATQLASGSGQITLASMGTAVLYVSVLGSPNVELRRLPKMVPNQGQVLASGPSASSFFSVITGAAGVHLLWRITGRDTATPSYTIEMVDEIGGRLYASAAGGFSLAVADASRLDFTRSENRTRFLFVEGWGARFFSATSLISYDTGTLVATRVGQLPGSAEFGADPVFANVVAGPAGPATGFASRTLDGTVQAVGTRVFSFDPASANSLKTTTRQQ